MGFINNMVIDSNGGVCLVRKLHYYKYNSIYTGCTCYDIITEVDDYISMGEYVLLYKNTNGYFHINTGDTMLCLSLGGQSIDDWFDNYINSLVTVGHNEQIVENRVILDNLTNTYYKVEHIKNKCDKDTMSANAIVNPQTNNLWFSGTTNYYYSDTDNCGVDTNVKFVKTRDINPNSPTYGEVQIITKCFD